MPLKSENLSIGSYLASTCHYEKQSPRSPEVLSPLPESGTDEEQLKSNQFFQLNIPASHFRLPFMKGAQHKIPGQFFQANHLQLAILQDLKTPSPNKTKSHRDWQFQRIFDFQNFKSLILLSVSNCGLKSLNSLKHSMYSLKFLSASHNCITTLPFLPILQELYASCNQIKSTEWLQNCNQLRVLDLAENQIQQVRQIERLSSLQSLQVLRVNGNNIQIKDMWMLMSKVFGKSVNCSPSFYEIIFYYSKWTKFIRIEEQAITFADHLPYDLWQHELTLRQSKQALARVYGLQVIKTFQDFSAELSRQTSHRFSLGQGAEMSGAFSGGMSGELSQGLAWGMSQGLPNRMGMMLRGATRSIPESELSESADLNITSVDRIDSISNQPYIFRASSLKTEVDKLHTFKSSIRKTLILMKEEPFLARRYFQELAFQGVNSADRSYLRPQNQLKQLTSQLMKIQNGPDNYSAQSSSIELLRRNFPSEKKPQWLMVDQQMGDNQVRPFTREQISDIPSVSSTAPHSVLKNFSESPEDIVKGPLRGVFVEMGGVKEADRRFARQKQFKK